jgi:hypothetical protein
MNVLLVHYEDGTTARYEDVRAGVDRDFHLATSVYEATHVTFTHAGGVEKLALRGVRWWEVEEVEEGEEE